MTAPKVKVGDLVDITIKSARVVDHNTTTDLMTVSVVDAESVIDLSGNVTVERVSPAEWPPQPGDLWRDNGDELWFAIGDDGVLLIPSYPIPNSRTGRDPQRVMKTVGPLTLVHREDGTR